MGYGTRKGCRKKRKGDRVRDIGVERNVENENERKL